MKTSKRCLGVCLVVTSAQKYLVLYDKTNARFCRKMWGRMYEMQFKAPFQGLFTFFGLTQKLLFLYNFFWIRLRLRLLKTSNSIVSKTALVFGRLFSETCSDEMMTKPNISKFVRYVIQHKYVKKRACIYFFT